MAEEIDPFEAAMQQMDGDDDAPASAEPKGEAAASGPADPFEAAMGAIDAPAATPAPAAPQTLPAVAKDTGLPPGLAPGPGGLDLDFLMNINLKLTFEVGRAKMYISDLLSLGQGSVIELHRLVGEELEIYVNGHLLATGEVVVVNEKFGARIVKILNPEERLLRLGPQP